MELCAAGDCEAYLRRMESIVARAEEVAAAAAAAASAAAATERVSTASALSSALQELHINDDSSSNSSNIGGGEAAGSSSARVAGKRAGGVAKSSNNRRAPAATPSASTSAAATAQSKYSNEHHAAAAAQATLHAVDETCAFHARSLLFQMTHAMYSARERLGLRHYDVKLLNFLVKPAEDAVSDGISTSSSDLIMLGDSEGSQTSVSSDQSATHSSRNSNNMQSSNSSGSRGAGPSSSPSTSNALVSAAPCGSSSSSSSLQSPLLQSLRLQYDFGVHSFAVPLLTLAAVVPPYAGPTPQHPLQLSAGQLSSLRQGMVAKLADFGTADTLPDSLGQPIAPAQFTTLENAPPEYWIAGDACTQGYAADTWALGLCAVHLLTGCAPYEEVMEGVRCPRPLRNALHALWTGAATSTRGGEGAGGTSTLYTYRTVADVIASSSLDGDDDDGVDAGGRGSGSSCSTLLSDTLYRVLVLTAWAGGNTAGAKGATAAASSSDSSSATTTTAAAAHGCYSEDNPVWALLRAALLRCPNEPADAHDAASAASAPAAAPGRKAPTAKGKKHTAAAAESSSAASSSSSTSAGSSSSSSCPLTPAECASASSAFTRDKALFSLSTGLSPLMVRARRRLAHLPGFEALITGPGGLLDLHPSRRATARAALLSNAFFPLRVPADGGGAGDARVLTARFPAFAAESDDELADV